MISTVPIHFRPETRDLKAYLAASKIVNFNQEAIHRISQQFLKKPQVEIERVKTIYEWVRDRIPHSFDIKGRIVTCSASEVLQHGEGICFAKAHLLAALLRSAGIPAGFCYQRLVLDDAQPSHLILHGLNAVYLQDSQRWIRLDARGNKPGVQAEFSLEQEQLAYPVRPAFQEIDCPTIYVQPDVGVIEALQSHTCLSQLASHLPTNLSQ